MKDVHEWLVQIGCRAPSVAPFDEATTVTYHDSCHLAHGQKVSGQPRALLRLLPGVTLVELAGVDLVLRQRRRLCVDAAGTG